jgi:hypothetical protein
MSGRSTSGAGDQVPLVTDDLWLGAAGCGRRRDPGPVGGSADEQMPPVVGERGEFRLVEQPMSAHRGTDFARGLVEAQAVR